MPAAPPSVPVTAGGGYRRDVQGLRAIAVLVVVADHASLGLAGGFVGVDVFFVVSGFLITQLLLGEVARSGRISLAGFYARRARRILPAASLVLVATAIGSALLLGPFRAPSALEDSVWAALFLANVRFARQGTDYFARDLPPSPVQHYWSLAVEEQFYLVWPLLLLAVVLGARALARRRAAGPVPSSEAPPSGRPPYAVVLVVLGLLTAVSLAWSVARTGADPTAAYFSGLTRAWELGIGALAAVLVAARADARSRGRRSGTTGRAPVMVDVAAAAGLAGVVVACLAYDDRTPFPGSAALLPVLATAVLLVAGAHGLERRTWTGRLLGLAPLRVVGDWSYSIYLWHWPLLVLAVAWAGDELSLPARLGVVALTLVLSALSYRFVENPVRRARLLRPTWRGIVLYPVSIALVLAGSVGGRAYVDWAEGRGDDPAVELASGWQQTYRTDDPAVGLLRASVEAARDGRPVPSDLVPRLTEVGDSVGDVGACDYAKDAAGATGELCPRGDADAERTVVVYGNSHARHWIDAFDAIGERLGYRVYYLVRVQCLASLVTPDEKGGGPFQDCADFHEWALDAIEEIEPDLLVVSSSGTRGGVYTADGEHVTDRDAVRAAIRQGHVDLFEQVVPSAARTVLLEDIPFAEPDPSACLAELDATLEGCLAEPRAAAAAAGRDQEAAAEEAGGVELVPTAQWFCWRRECPAVVGDVLPYRDGEHITNEYSADLAEPLARALDLAPDPA